MNVSFLALLFITAGAALAQGFSGFGYGILAGIVNVIKGMAG